MAKDAFYFSHDANARNDLKCIRLRREMGMAGYGLYWCLLEMLREENRNSLSFSYIEDIASHLGVKPEDVKSVITKYDLFKIEGKIFYSARLSESVENYNALKNKQIEAGRKGGLSRAKAWLEGDLKPTVHQKGKESKGKERKEKGGVGENAKGRKFDTSKTFVIFQDGSKQKLGTNQLHAISENKLQAKDVTKGIIY